MFSVMTPENLRFSTSSIFLVCAFPGMHVISVLQDTHFQKDVIVFFSETSAAVHQQLRVKRVTAYHLELAAILRNTLR